MGMHGRRTSFRQDFMKDLPRKWCLRLTLMITGNKLEKRMKEEANEWMKDLSSAWNGRERGSFKRALSPFWFFPSQTQDQSNKGVQCFSSSIHYLQFSLVQFSSSVVSDSLRPHELQHARPPCPSPTPGVHSDSTSIESVMPSSHLILCRPLLLLPPVPPSIKVF